MIADIFIYKFIICYTNNYKILTSMYINKKIIGLN